MSETNGTPPAPDAQPQPQPQPVPSHIIDLRLPEPGQTTLRIAFGKPLPYDLADSIKAGADPLTAFLKALECLTVVSIVTTFGQVVQTKQEPQIEVARAMPPPPPQNRFRK